MSGAFSCISGLRCVTCGATYEAEAPVFTCPACGPLAGTLDALYDTERVARAFTARPLAERSERTLWRYHEILPVRDARAPLPLPVGLTPLYPLRADFGSPSPSRMWVKDETRHPSGSAKDRATAVAIAHARAIRAPGIAAASTGNAASSLATFAAHAAMPCFIFAPASAPPAKLIQIRAHGARLFAVEGTYDDAFDLCARACERHGWYSRNTASNPYLGEGKKTAAFEIYEQLGDRAPDAVVVPVGDGCILGGVYKGFRDLRDLAWIDRMPRLIGVQAAGSAALADAWRRGEDRCAEIAAATLADSICVSVPRDQVKALRAVRETGGLFVSVSDEAILDAMSLLARRAGIFAEPAAAASLAGLRAALEDGSLKASEEVVLLMTGHGLKDTGAAEKAARGNPAVSIHPDMAELDRAL